MPTIHKQGIKMTNQNHGFTLIEVMVALAIAGILVGMALPSFTDMLQKDKGIAQINQLVGELSWARTEAIVQGKTVSLCASTNQLSCRSSKTNWSDGWIVFIDQDGDGDFNDNGNSDLCETGEDCLINSVKIASADTLVARIDDNTLSFTKLSFTKMGKPNPEAEYTITYTPENCPSGQSGRKFEIKVLLIGKAYKEGVVCP